MEFCQRQNSQAIRRSRIAGVGIKKLGFIERAYELALEFYSSVREAAKRRVDSAETLYHALSPFFKSWGKKHEEDAQPTKKQELRDFKGLQRGTHNGMLFIENEKPKLTGGKRKTIDESFKNTAEFKESEDGEIKE